MKTIKHTIITITLCSALAVLATACDDEPEPSDPNITLYQVGSGGEPTGGSSGGELTGGSSGGELTSGVVWLVSIQRLSSEGTHWCSGAIINDAWILTAAHCVKGRSAASLQVLAGIDRLGDSPPDQARRGVDRIVMHPSYAEGRLGHHDLALLRLDAPLDVVELGLSAIELGKPADLEPTVTGILGLVSGWGPLSSGGDPDARQDVSVELLSNAEARAIYGTPIIAEQLASKWGEAEACQADGGGPLVLQTLEQPRLVGVATKGTGCADPSSLQIYTRVSSYLEWIDSEVAALDE